jgi:hypothetical protein
MPLPYTAPFSVTGSTFAADIYSLAASVIDAGTLTGASSTQSLAGNASVVYTATLGVSSHALTVTNVVPGMRLILELTQDATGSRAFTLNGTSIRLDPTPSVRTVVPLFHDGTAFVLLNTPVGATLLPLSDLLADADNTPIASHAGESGHRWFNGHGDPKIISNSLRATVDGSNAVSTVIARDFDLTATGVLGAHTAGFGSGLGIRFRQPSYDPATLDSDFLMFKVYASASDATFQRVEWHKRQGGVDSALLLGSGGLGLTLGTQFTIRLVVRGAVMLAYINGTLRGAYQTRLHEHGNRITLGFENTIRTDSAWNDITINEAPLLGDFLTFADLSSDRSLAFTDLAGPGLVHSGAGARVLTVPTNATVPFVDGTVFPLRQSGAGSFTVAGATGVTITRRPAASALQLAGQYAEAALTKVGTDTWQLSGDLVA